jgi:hypothetical protein
MCTLDLHLRKKLVKSHIWGITFYGVKTWTLQNINHKLLESSETWCWRRVEKISVTDRVRNEEVLLAAKAEIHVIHQVKQRKAIWFVTSCVGTVFENIALKVRW